VGTIAPGKRADLIVFDGEPMAYSSPLLLVVSGGRLVLDRRSPGEGR
jgi:imidazolonepropionase-like amidohydrolase